ncbi:hypothetical protein C3F09_04905 [candidate division GN15 bacterium]|uniref:Uncharacterized protein n=1 Tax=candidate division GN15 bacterium TaxID=2072418 RepID=A0A855X7M4_9BACT|nr:MAG: hypothetical protein C3F09_04905 [candidate division GN15 bacterium]
MSLIALVLGSCGRGPGRYGYERPRTKEPLVWQTAWVDPRIVVSDTVLTLFQAGRIDSLQVEQSRAGKPANGAVEFQIEDISCDVEINLLDTQSRLIRHLMKTSLSAGYYKLTLNPGAAKRLIIVPGEYRLSVHYCRQAASGPVNVT